MLDRIIPGLTELLHQAGMRWHPAHPLLAPLRAIDHLRQVFVQLLGVLSPIASSVPRLLTANRQVRQSRSF